MLDNVKKILRKGKALLSGKKNTLMAIELVIQDIFLILMFLRGIYYTIASAWLWMDMPLTITIHRAIVIITTVIGILFMDWIART